MTRLTSFQADIRPLFTERDIEGMKKGFNLASYDDVKAHAPAIYDRIRGIGGALMPPPPPRGEGPCADGRCRKSYALSKSNPSRPSQNWRRVGTRGFYQMASPTVGARPPSILRIAQCELGEQSSDS